MNLKLKLKRIKELFALGKSYIKSEGLGSTCKKTWRFFRRRFGGKRGRFLPTAKALQKRKESIAAGEGSQWPVISILVPLYNTPHRFLKEMLSSVTGQIAPNWQLCLADASDEAHAHEVKAIVDACRDSRIVYQKIENKDIASNTNAAAKLATGSYIGLLDHDDILAPHAIYEMSKAISENGAAFLYSDEALFTKQIQRPTVGHFKPDYSESYLLSCNYICHFAVFRRALFEKVGGFRSECAGSQDHDLFLRLIEENGAPLHLPKVLYYWRVHEQSTSGGTGAKPYVTKAAIRAIQEHLDRTGTAATAEEGLFPSTYRVRYQIEEEPLVSIMIPTMEHIEDLDTVLRSIYEKTTYSNFEVLVVENNSHSRETFAYYQTIPKKYPTARVLYYKDSFNYSAINNFARLEAKGEFLLLLNNDVEVINGDWLTELVGQGMQHDVGAVGAMLYYPDDTIQHAGIITGLGGYAGHNQKYQKRGKSGYMFRLATVQDLSAVTGACMLVRTEAYDEISGLDEGFAVAYNDVDFCLRLRRAGWRIVFTPYAELYHYESKSRGLDEKNKEKAERFNQEKRRLDNRFGDALLHDPFYNPNLTLDSEDFAENAVLDRE